MAASITGLSVTLSTLTDTEIATLKTEMPPNGVFATYIQNSGQGNLEDLNQSNFSGTITFRPAAPNNAEDCGKVFTLIANVVTDPLMGWEEV